MNSIQKLAGLLLFLFISGTSCDPEEEVFVDEFSLVSAKWRLDDSSEGCIDGPGNTPGSNMMIFRLNGEFIARGYGQEATGTWSLSSGTIRIMGVNYNVRQFSGTKLELQHKECITTYIAVGLDEITYQGASSISQHGAMLKGIVETNFSENLKIEVEYGYTVFYGERATLLDNITSKGYPAITVSGELTGLAPGSRYHYRLKAIKNSGEEFYGPPMTLQTFNEVQLQDVDGNIYNTVTVENRVWMAENLRVTKLRDGTPIQTVDNDIVVWRDLSEPAMAWNPAERCGAYYNWYAVGTEQLCPVGWHVPTSVEWRQLKYLLGSNPKYELMEASSDYWISNVLTTNETGFSALGCDSKQKINFWTGTSNSDPHFADNMMLDIYVAGFNESSTYKWRGNCIRCIRD